MDNNQPKEYDIKTNDEWRQLGMTIENWSPPSFDLAVVPRDLHDLVSLAHRWGISCDVTRHDAAEKASQKEFDEIAQQMKGRHDLIYRWLYSVDDPVPKEAAAFLALLVFEMEEAKGPGIPGLLDWRIREFKRDSCEQNRTLLKQAYDKVQSWSPLLKQRQPLAEAEKILCTEQERM